METLKSKEAAGLDEGIYTELQPVNGDLPMQESSAYPGDLKADGDRAIQQAVTVSQGHPHDWTVVICPGFRIESRIPSC